MQHNNTEEIALLRTAVENENLPDSQRRDAAAHLMQMIVAGVQEPDNDDTEVQARMQPSADSTLAAIFGSADGESLPLAKHETWKRHKLRAVLARVVNESAHRLERLAACEWLLANYGFISKWKLNSYKADRLLSEVLPATATKYVDLNAPVQVSRPPVELKDVWRL